MPSNDACRRGAGVRQPKSQVALRISDPQSVSGPNVLREWATTDILFGTENSEGISLLENTFSSYTHTRQACGGESEIRVNLSSPVLTSLEMAARVGLEPGQSSIR
jgi:hypothetical protein